MIEPSRADTAAPIILDHITVASLDCISLVELAAECGYDGVSLWVANPAPSLRIETVRKNTPRFRDVMTALHANNVLVYGVECFGMTGEGPTDDTRRSLETAAELGARVATLAFFASLPHGHNVELIGRMADMSAEFGLAITIEVMAQGVVPGMTTYTQALATIADAGRSNVGLTLDMLHLTRTGTTPAEVASIPANLISYIQLCDGPATMPTERQLWEAGYGRLFPGEGEFAITDYLAALPQGVPIGLEAPRLDMAPQIVARQGLVAMRDVLAAAQQAR